MACYQVVVIFDVTVPHSWMWNTHEGPGGLVQMEHQETGKLGQATATRNWTRARAEIPSKPSIR